MATDPLIVREHQEINGLSKEDMANLKEFVIRNQHDRQGNYAPVLQIYRDELKARNYVGMIQTQGGRVLEILPKIDLVEGDNKETKKIFLRMLSAWHNLKWVQFGEGDIDELKRFDMLEIFVHLFLNDLVTLTKRGLARNYQPIEDNLPCLKGRIVFAEHIRHNIANEARFYVRYDEFTADYPVNRLIRSTIDKLALIVREQTNYQLLHQMRICFGEVSRSHNYHNDWDKHKIDRTIPHYRTVMQWVGLFLFGHGLTTFSGRHANNCLLFPMERIFEDYVAYAFRYYQKHSQERYQVRTKGYERYLATINNSQDHVFQLQPDIRLEKNGRAMYVLDAKWKRINGNSSDTKHGISPADMYQLYAYGRKYECGTVALIYPRTRHFTESHQFHFNLDSNPDLSLLCLPFDVSKPERSVNYILDILDQQPKN